MKIKFNKLLLTSMLATSTLPIVVSASCSSTKPYDPKLKSEFLSWYESISNGKFNKNNYHCENEAQAIILYANKRGHFWNEALHKQLEPTDTILQGKAVRGQDYKLIDTALNKAVFPYDYQVYHGVEYQEDEFYEQLKDYIKLQDDGKYNYDECVGKEITSYGFFSTSVSRKEALEYCDGYVFNNIDQEWGKGDFHLPLKEEVLFEINVPKGYVGAAYLADYEFAGWKNEDKQVLIHRNASFRIKRIYKEGKVNVFEVDLIQKSN